MKNFTLVPLVNKKNVTISYRLYYITKIQFCNIKVIPIWQQHEIFQAQVKNYLN